MVNEVAGNTEDTMNLTKSLGGEERLKEMRNFLDDLRKDNISVKIVSTSWYPITEAQWQEYLFYVSDILELGFSKDEILAVEDPGEGLSADKGERIRNDKKNSMPKTPVKCCLFTRVSCLLMTVLEISNQL